MKNNKMDQLLEILEQINDIYPNVDKIVINDPYEPDYIIIASTDYINSMAESLGYSEIGDMADQYDSIESLKPKKKKTIQ